MEGGHAGKHNRGMEVTVRNLDTGRVDVYNCLGFQLTYQPNPEAFPVLVLRGGTEDNHVLMLASMMHNIGHLQPKTWYKACMLRDGGRLPTPTMLGPQQELKS